MVVRLEESQASRGHRDRSHCRVQGTDKERGQVREAQVSLSSCFEAHQVVVEGARQYGGAEVPAVIELPAGRHPRFGDDLIAAER